MIFWCPQCKQKYEGGSQHYQGTVFICHICEFKFIVPMKHHPKPPEIKTEFTQKTKAIEKIIADFKKEE